MARSINEIQELILSAKRSSQSLQSLEVLTDREKNTLQGLNSTSKVAVWRSFVFIISVGIWSLEKLFDEFKVFIDALIAKNKIHNFDWYIQTAKNFQFGFSLQEDGTYDNTGVDEGLVIASKIVKQVAVDQLSSRLRFKLAKEDGNGQLIKMDETEISAFSQYMEKVKDAGTRLTIYSRDADLLKLEVDIYYDPQVLNTIGQRHDGTSDTPVQDQIQLFSRNLEFNGELILTKLTDFLQKIDGVLIPVIKKAEAKYALNDYTAIDERYIPDSGYFLFDQDNSVINFIDVTT